MEFRTDSCTPKEIFVATRVVAIQGRAVVFTSCSQILYLTKVKQSQTIFEMFLMVWGMEIDAVGKLSGGTSCWTIASSEFNKINKCLSWWHNANSTFYIFVLFIYWNMFQLPNFSGFWVVYKTQKPFHKSK